MERLTRGQLLEETAVRRDNFRNDDSFPAAASRNNDYAGARYQRGHQAPAEDFRSNQIATDNSFQMSNMAPQIGPGFNGSQWKLLEEDVRAWVVCGGRTDLIVITGPIYSGEADYMVSGPRNARRTTNVRVPDAFFKIVYDLRSGFAVGFLVPHERRVPRVAVEEFIVPISLIEDETGLDFFRLMPRRRQTQLESSPGRPWGHIATCAALG
jgi:endonuclease G